MGLNSKPVSSFSDIADSRFQLTTDAAGTPGHSTSGSNLYITNVQVSRIPLTIRSIGEVSVIVQDESLVNNTVSHGVQIHRKSTGSGPQAGLGTGVQIFIEDTAGSVREAGNLQIPTTDVTSGNFTSYMDLRVCCNGAANTTSLWRLLGATHEAQAHATSGHITAPVFAGSSSWGQINVANGGEFTFNAGNNNFIGASGGTGYASAFTTAFSGNIVDFQRGTGGNTVYKMDFLGRLYCIGVVGIVAASGTNAGSGQVPAPVVTAGSNDTRGNITFGSGNAASAGTTMVTVTFSQPYNSLPFVQATPKNTLTRNLGLYIANVTNAGFTIGGSNAPAANQANTAYSIDYLVLG